MIGFYLYLSFIISYFLHLTSRIPFLGEIRFDLLLMGALLILAILEELSKKRERVTAFTTRMLLYLCGYIILSLPLVRWPGSVLRFGMDNLLKVIFFYFFTVAFVYTERRLKIILWVFIGSQILRIIEPAYLHLTTGYWGSAAHSSMYGEFYTLNRLSGAPHDIVNPNQLAWVGVNIIPFLYFIVWKFSRKIKIFVLACAPVLIYVLVLTGSRSGIISLFVVLTAIAVIETKKLKSVLIIAVIAFPMTMLAAGQLSPNLKERYMSLVDPAAVGRDTIEGRLNALKHTLSYMSDKAIFGHGLGTSRETNWNVIGRSARITHNLYLEIIQEIGFIGLVFFMIYVYAIYKQTISVKKRISDRQFTGTQLWLFNLASALQAWIIMDLIYSLACFGLSSWEWYWFGGLSAVCYKLAVRNTRNERVSAISKKKPGDTAVAEASR